MTTKRTAAEEFRYLTGLLAIKTGASVMASDLTPTMQKEASTIPFDEILSRLLGMAIVLEIWHKT